MAELTFPRTPRGSLGELWQAAIDLLPQITPRVLRDRTVGTTETPIAHGLGFAPLMAHPVPHSDARVWRTRTPDAKYVYLAASGAVVCDVEVVP